MKGLQVKRITCNPFYFIGGLLIPQIEFYSVFGKRKRFSKKSKPFLFF